MPDHAWTSVTEYLHLVAGGEYEAATDLLDDAIQRDGEASIVDALEDCCRSLMDRVIFPAGFVDVYSAIGDIARRIVKGVADSRVDAADDMHTVLVFLGSEGLRCHAATTVANWPPVERLRNMVACTIGLAAIVAADERTTINDVAVEIARPGAPRPAAGRFEWAGSVSFVAERPASLRSILTRVALLRHTKPDDEVVIDLRDDESCAAMPGRPVMRIDH